MTARHLMPASDPDVAQLKLPPHSIEAEQSLLGAILIDNAVIENVAGVVSEADFYSDPHRLIFAHARALIANGTAADLVTVAEALLSINRLDYVGGMAYLGACAQNVPTTSNALHYAQIVRERSMLRQIAAAAHTIADDAMTPGATSRAVLANALAKVGDIATAANDDATSDDVQVAGIYEAADAMPDLRFVATPILAQGALFALTARTGHGKSTLACAIAFAIVLNRNLGPIEVVRSGLVVYVSAEDYHGTRLRAYAEAVRHKLTSEHRAAVNQTLRWVRVKEGASVDEILTRVRADVGDLAVALVVVDTQAALYNGDDDNDNVQRQAEARELRRLTMLPGSPAVLVLVHPTKNATADNLVPRGGGAFLNAIDGNLTLWNDDGKLRLHHGKLRAPYFDPIEFRLDSMTIELASGDIASTVVAVPIDASAADAIEGQVGERRERILAALLRAGGTVSIRVLTERTGDKRWAVQTDLASLATGRSPLVEKDQLDGRYTLTTAGRKLAATIVARDSTAYQEATNGR
jgi:replicative DNA helicase